MERRGYKTRDAWSHQNPKETKELLPQTLGGRSALWTP